MSAIRKFFIVILGLVLFTSCDCIEGEGPIVKETRNLDGFEGIDLRASADLYITKSDRFEIRIEGQQNILDVLTTRIKGHNLVIEFQDVCVINTRSLDIYISMPELSELYVSGSGDVESEDAFETDDLNLGISGSGSIDLDVIARRIDVRLSGSGDIYLAGESNQFYSTISGSGNIKANRLKTLEANIRISGSGSTYIYAVEDIDVRISGSGNVHYSGNPDINTSVSGSGNIRKVK